MSLELSKKAMAIKPSSTMAITEKAKDMKKNGCDVISFSAGEPDFRTPENICDAGKKAIDQGLTKYTKASGLDELKAAISEKFRKFNKVDYAPEQIVISNGGKHSISNAFTAILNDGDEVLIPAPCWVTYSESAKLAGGVPVIIYTKKENSYKMTAKELEAAYTEKTKALILNTPNNPTGMIYTREELLQIAEFAVSHDIYVIADEVYEYLCYEGMEHVSIASLGEEIYQRTITISGLSKSYAMTGWRIGYTGAPLEITRLMSSIQSQQTSNPNTIAQHAAIEALTGDQSAVGEMAAAYNERRKFIYQKICAIEGLSCTEPMGAFYVFADITEFLGKTYKDRTIKTAADFADLLLNEFYVAVIPCQDFGFTDHIRLSYSISQEEIEQGMDRIEEFCKCLMVKEEPEVSEEPVQEQASEDAKEDKQTEEENMDSVHAEAENTAAELSEEAAEAAAADVAVEEAATEEAAPEPEIAAEETAPAEEPETSEEEMAAPEPEVIESMDDYTEEIDASLQKIYPGDVMECTVVAVDEEAVSVDLDYYAPGKIPPEEMSADPLFSVFTDVQIGDQFRAIVQQADDGAGNIILSRKEADREFAWEKLEQLMEEEAVIEGTVSGVTNSGAVLYVEGIRGFIPASKLDLKYVEDTNPYLGKKLKVQITEADKDRRKLILSAKELLVEEAARKRQESAGRLSVGSVMDGVVEKIMDYGAFVNIGNDLTGLLHVSQISEKRISHPKAVLKEGQKVSVTIIKVENGKISLSMKAAKEAEEEALNEEAQEYKSEYIPNNPFAALLKDIKLDD